jgi:hypothetical protein
MLLLIFKTFIMKKNLLSMILAIAIPCIVSATPITSKAYIEIKNAATSGGTIVFQFTPDGGLTISVRVEIKKGWTSLQISREIARKLTDEMPSEYRATSRTHGAVNYVDVEKDMTRVADFDIQKNGMTVNGTTIKVKYMLR